MRWGGDRKRRVDRCLLRVAVTLPPDTYLVTVERTFQGGPGGVGRWRGKMDEVWVLKQTVLRAQDEQALERRLHSLKCALRRREGSIVQVERAPVCPSSRHIAVISYEIPLSAFPVAARG